MRPRESIDELLNAPEGEHCQFKEWKNKDDLREAAKICCALANCGGGRLVLGISDKRPRKVVGSMAFPQPERTRLDLMAKLRVRIDFYTYDHENGRVLVFDVGSHPVGLPVQADDGAWWYHGDSLILMPEDVRWAIYAENPHDFSADVCPGATIDDLDSGAIEIFRKKWCDYSKNKRIKKLTVMQLLKDCAAVSDDGVTYAALILFGKTEALRKYMPHSEIVFEYRSKESAGPAAHRVDFLVGFFHSYDKIWELVNLRNDQQHYQDRFAVLPVYTFNERVVREAILNAVSHRNYQMAGNIFVRQFARRIEIENPGGFPHGVTVENILDKQSARNACIANIFQLCGLVERAGQGMNMIYETAMREAKPLPDFKGSDAYFVKLTLNGQVYDPHMLAMIKKTNDDILDALTTDDYYLLSVFFHRKRYAEIHRSRFGHLEELGLVKMTKRGIELLGKGIILLTDENGVHYVDNGADVTINDADEVVNGTNDPVNDANDPVNDPDEVVNEVVNRQNKILTAIKANPKITIKQISSQLGISKATVERTIAAMKNTQIKRIGSDKTGHWEVIHP